MVAGNAQLLDFVLKRCSLEAQARRRPVRPGKNASRFAERLDDVLAFRPFQGRGETLRTAVCHGIELSEGNL